VDLDEEFARSLVMQDEQHQNQNQYRSPPQQQQQGIPSADQLPYQARVRRTRPAQDQYQSPPQGGSSWDRQGGDNPNGMLAVEDKINKFAESTSYLLLFASRVRGENRVTDVQPLDRPSLPSWEELKRNTLNSSRINNSDKLRMPT
jgi:hypothetical protein